MWDFSASGNIICMGSIIMDISVKCEQFPETGETRYTPYPYEVTPGGKGANQAIAAARSGGKVRMLGRIADDLYGYELRENLRQAGIDTDMLIEDKNEKSGVAFVRVNECGDNQIICSPGVHAKNTADDVKKGLEMMKEGDILLMTMEFPRDVLMCAVKLAKEKGGFVIVDPSAAEHYRLDEQMAEYIDIIKPNEVEAEIITGIKVKTREDMERALEFMEEKGISYPLISLGQKGIIYKTGGKVCHEQGIAVETVDSTAAGDTFIGALACCLAAGKTIEEAIEYGNKAAAKCVQKMGAQASIPYAEDIEVHDR